MSEKMYNKRITAFIIQIIVYLIVAVPFKVMSVIPGFTDIRPVLTMTAA